MEKYIVILCCVPVFADQHRYLEKDYQKAWCDTNNGKTEVILPDKARADCVTATHAVEVDFAPKWAESIGQSLYYAKVLNKKPGILIIMENGEKDLKYLKHVKSVADSYGITVWTITPSDIDKAYFVTK